MDDEKKNPHYIPIFVLVGERLALSLLIARVVGRSHCSANCPKTVELQLLTLYLDKGWKIGVGENV